MKFSVFEKREAKLLLNRLEVSANKAISNSVVANTTLDACMNMFRRQQKLVKKMKEK